MQVQGCALNHNIFGSAPLKNILNLLIYLKPKLYGARHSLAPAKREILEKGSHNELIKKDGKYAELWSHQAGGFLE